MILHLLRLFPIFQVPTSNSMRLALYPLALAVVLAACAAPIPSVTDDAPVVNAAQLLEDLQTLSAPDMAGRRPNTPGHERAQNFIVERFTDAGVQPVGAAHRHEFMFVPRGAHDEERGVNILAMVPGSVYLDLYIVVTAHYDHLGVRNGDIYHGADDNASGTAALFAIAAELQRQAPRHSVILAAVDAEEMGLRGARHFVANPPVPQDQIVLNINMDMISRNDADELYAAGAFHYPFLAPVIQRTAANAPITLLMGHDDPALGPREDWTMLSDHGAFHEAGIPFVYFGVEDHEDYHQPTDTFENIHPDFYPLAVETVIGFLREVDGERLSGRR
ncbi:M20/M25/M40 family metallo-hydrolase [soil metagenome]